MFFGCLVTKFTTFMVFIGQCLAKTLLYMQFSFSMLQEDARSTFTMLKAPKKKMSAIKVCGGGGEKVEEVRGVLK
jgi:hypothetical protein